MIKPCDICLDKECKASGGVGSCNCETCAVKDCCPKRLQPTIRITLKCTQSCSHCCFSCSPTKDTHMSIETATKIAKFLKAHEVFSINLMGGEIICNPNWKQILDILIPSVEMARIVSNGDWVEHENEFAEYISKHNNCYVAISKDQWHTNKNIEAAEQLLIKNDVICKISDIKQNESSLVPIGNAEYTSGVYSMFSCYCHNPEHQYAFLIDEKGDIFKCGFGVWDYAHIDDYQEGGFAERFKEFNKVFYNTFISSCAGCIRGYQLNGM